MQESLDKINTSLEAHNLVKDPTKLLSLLFSKYGDIKDDYYASFTNQVLYKCSSHFSIQFREIQYNDVLIEFLRRIYKKKEVVERIPNLYDYYKNYHLFYLKPVLRNFYLENLLHKYQDKKAEIFYKNNYSQTSKDKKISDDNSETSSLSSSDHYTDNKIIFNTKTKLLLDGNNYKDSSSLMDLQISKINKNNNSSIGDLRLSIKTYEENTLNEIMKELKKDNKNNTSKNKKKNSKTKTQRNSRKNNSPKIHSKSPTYQMSHQIQLIKSTNNNINNNYNYNLISPQMYIMSQKNSHSKNKNNSHKNKIYFSPKPNYYLNNIVSKFEEVFKKYPNFMIRIKHKRNKTGNNSNNNTIKKSINNNNINSNIFGNNFQSNFKIFSKLSSSLKNNKFNVTYFSQINSNNNSRNSMSGNKSNKLHKNKKVIKEINQSNIKTKKVRHKKNKTFDFNVVGGKLSELKKNYTNYNLLRFKPSPSNALQSKKPIGLTFNLMKSPKNEIILRNRSSQGSNANKSKNKRFISGNSKGIKKNKKSFISIASCSSPKFSFLVSKNETNIRESLTNNFNNLEGNMYNFLSNNKKIITKLRKNKYKKNNISYTNNNYNINFNNVFFCSSRPNSGPHSNNAISDNTSTNGNMHNKNQNINNNLSNVNNLTSNNSIILNNKKNTPKNFHKNNILNPKNNNINNNCSNNISNLYVKSLNNLYNFSRNKNYKISNCSQTQTQSQSIVKNSKIIKISESKIPVNKTNSFILHCNNKSIIDEKSINKIHKKYKRVKMMNQIEDLIMKSKKNIKFGNEYKIGSLMANKPSFNNCNNKSKNQTQNKSNYHEMFIKNLKRTSSTSIKVNSKSIANNNQAINVIYKK